MIPKQARPLMEHGAYNKVTTWGGALKLKATPKKHNFCKNCPGPRSKVLTEYEDLQISNPWFDEA